MFNLLQITIWVILLLFIASKIRNKYWSIIFSKVAACFITLEIVAIYLTDRLVDYRFYNHLNINAVEGHGFQFITHFILFSVLFVSIVFLLYFGSKYIQKIPIHKNRYFVPIILFSFILLSWPNGVLNEVYSIYKILDAEEKNFKNALIDVGISPDKYITPSQLTAEAGKNIIVISIESLEQGFLGPNFNNIAPNLKNLSKEWTYYDYMPVSPGGDWTAASLYSHQVGMPAFFKGPSNAVFQGITNVKLTGLGHVLNKAGYNSKYLVGSKEFAGMSDILTAYGIEAISEKNSLGKYPENRGLYDFDLFQEAKLQIQVLKKDKGKPFALFLSTINTHFPNGIYDKRMGEYIPKRDTNLEFSVSAVDYLIKDFITYLKNEGLYDNTAIYIFPDHLLMGSNGKGIENLKKSKRNLYLITNVGENELPKKTTDTLYQIDLPKMIISGAQIDTNANFLVDFIETNNVIDFIRKNRVNITTLNKASIAKKDYNSGITINVSGNNLIISSDEDSLVLKLDIKQDHEIFNIAFNSEMVVLGNTQSKRNFNDLLSINPYYEKYKWLYLIVNIKGGVIDKTYFGNKKHIGIYKSGKQVIYTNGDVNLITESNNTIL